MQDILFRHKLLGNPHFSYGYPGSLRQSPRNLNTAYHATTSSEQINGEHAKADRDSAGFVIGDD
jgi:hypothetical protein